VLWSLQHDPSSPYARFFVSNLRPIGNSLFSYLALGLMGHLSEERIASLALFAALWGFPLSAIAFSGALRRAATPEERSNLPNVAATSLACPLAYNYFFYRGFFNYAVSVPLAMLCLAGVVASGDERARRLARASFGAGAVVFGLLAALAHPAAMVLLLVATPAACLRGSELRRIVGGAVTLLLILFAGVSRVSTDGPSPTRFSSPFSAIWMAVRAVGVTHTLLEVISALALLGLVGWGAVRVSRQIRSLRTTWATFWPAALALVLIPGYFFVPFEFGGAAGLNERIPLFVAMLLLPYVPLTRKLGSGLVVGFTAFSLYTAIESVPRDARAERIREARGASLIPRGSVVYPVSLQIKLGSLSADLGRHILADVARRHDLVAPEVFCGHPAHVLRCQKSVPAGYDESPIQEFEHLSWSERRRALNDPRGALGKTFAQMVEGAKQTDYLLVVGAAPLDDAFNSRVLVPLGASLLGPADGPVRAYRLPGAGRPEAPVSAPPSQRPGGAQKSPGAIEGS
jgi:hypothetical protein